MTPEEEIKKAEEQQGKNWVSYEDKDFNPVKNPKVISIMQMEDGNFKVFGLKHGKMLVIRSGKPEDVLTEFLTHE
jgi:hypothetical protein